MCPYLPLVYLLPERPEGNSKPFVWVVKLMSRCMMLRCFQHPFSSSFLCGQVSVFLYEAVLLGGRALMLEFNLHMTQLIGMF